MQCNTINEDDEVVRLNIAQICDFLYCAQNAILNSSTHDAAREYKKCFFWNDVRGEPG